MKTRSVAINQAQIEAVENIAFSLIREHRDEEASRLLAIALAWKLSPEVQFHCDIDESGGLAELYDFGSHSKKVS